MVGWLRPKGAAGYCSVSERTIHDFLKDGLKHIKRRGIILIRVQDIDEYLSRFSVNDESIVDDIVKDVLEEIRR